MIRVFCCCLFVVVYLTSPMSVSAELGHIRNVVNIGSDVGYSNAASGKAFAVIHQGNCNYSFELLENQHVRINNPDVVFLESNITLREKNWPYLDQKSIYAGYYWSFRKDDSLGLKWFGLMCDDIGSFDFQESNEKTLEEISPELEDIKQINSSKCPGVLRGKNGFLINILAYKVIMFLTR